MNNMNKHFKVITINGIRGIFMAAFIVFGLAAGFIISPAWVCMKLWNIAAGHFYFAPMNIFQGLLLWAAAALSLYALNNKRPLVGFGFYPGISRSRIKDIIKRTKTQGDEIMKETNSFKDAVKRDIFDVCREDKDNKTASAAEKDSESAEDIKG